MRVIAGQAKGRRLKAVKGLDTRPTTDRVKESVFAILAPLIAGARVLDLFAGTGALGIEALSRGAAHAFFFERDGGAFSVLKENVESTGVSDRSTLRKVDAFKGIASLPAGTVFDLVFVDPPYLSDKALLALERLQELGLLSSEATVVVEHPAKKELPTRLQNLIRVRQEKYGETMVSFFRPEREGVE